MRYPGPPAPPELVHDPSKEKVLDENKPMAPAEKI